MPPVVLAFRGFFVRAYPSVRASAARRDGGGGDGVCQVGVVVVDGPLELSKIGIFLLKSRKPTIPIFGMLGGDPKMLIPSPGIIKNWYLFNPGNPLFPVSGQTFWRKIIP